MSGRCPRSCGGSKNTVCRSWSWQLVHATRTCPMSRPRPAASRAGSQGARAARCPRAWRWSTSPNPREADPGRLLQRRRRWFRRLRPTGNRAAGGEGAVRGSSRAELALCYYRTARPQKRAGIRAPPRIRAVPAGPHRSTTADARNPSAPRTSSMTLKIPQRYSHPGDLVIGRGAAAATIGRDHAADRG